MSNQLALYECVVKTVMQMLLIVRTCNLLIDFLYTNTLTMKHSHFKLFPYICPMVTILSFSGWRFGCLEDDQKPVWTSLSRNCWKLPCMVTGIALLTKQVHIIDKRHTYFVLKGFIWFQFLLKHWKRGEVWPKMFIFLFSKKIKNVTKTYFVGKVFLFNALPVGFGFIWLEPKVGLFHY